MKNNAGFFSIFKKYLRYTFYPIKDFRCDIIERPGLYLSDSQLQKLKSDLHLIAKHSLSDKDDEQLNYGVLSDRIEAYNDAILTIIYDETTNAPVAFNALSYLSLEIMGREQDLVHLGLVMVDKEYHKRGLSWVLYGYTSFLLFFRNLCKPIWISSVTQVPSVYGQVSESYTDVYPKLKGRKTFNHQHIAHEIMSRYRHVFGVGAEAEFDEDNFIIRNAYTGGSNLLKKRFTQAAKHRNDSYNKQCLEKLNYDRGDDFLQIGLLDIFAVKQFLLNSVPKNRWVQVLTHMGLLILSSIVLPVLHWFIPSQQLGEIRAYSNDKK